uniref:Uncharacterized protein AlNc14C43G3583 n=1 Tax=Albugo laibachii Nc14 TaxID=890382 RepID=F0WA39_9STRA|nr:conserved hypothetical protein [Albugo laibachii Nc14]|eukprot:CCA18009.1 conserved hypothetical protein [Albugo laibachii Nc14]
MYSILKLYIRTFSRMSVVGIQGESDWNAQLSKAGGKLVVADFSATWCGPCQYIKPIFESFSRQYTDVVFLNVDEAQNRSLIQSLGVRGFPTFHLYINRAKVDELVGADTNSLRNKIEQWRQSAFNPFASAGVSLGGQSTLSEDPREARLKRLAKVDANAENCDIVCDADGSCRLPSDCEVKDDVKAKDVGSIVSEEYLNQLKEMGFTQIRAQKALLATGSEGLEAAINWIGEHQEDPDIDEPIVNSMESASTKVLTEEEKARKLAALEAKIEQRRQERIEKEKKEKIENEIKRRTTGRDMQKARDEIEDIQRKIAVEKLKKEREQAKIERELIRKQFEMDKLERRARGGKLTGAPIDLPIETLQTETKAKSTQPKVHLSPRQQIASSIDKLKQYRMAGDGLTALKTLNMYLKNLIEKPDEEKFRSINLDNAAFRKRVASLVGGIAFLKALGYEKDESDNTLKLDIEKRDMELLKHAKTCTESAIAALA